MNERLMLNALAMIGLGEVFVSYGENLDEVFDGIDMQKLSDICSAPFEELRNSGVGDAEAKQIFARLVKNAFPEAVLPLPEAVPA